MIQEDRMMRHNPRDVRSIRRVLLSCLGVVRAHEGDADLTPLCQDDCPEVMWDLDSFRCILCRRRRESSWSLFALTDLGSIQHCMGNG